jgi:type VI secretion system protein ImpH
MASTQRIATASLIDDIVDNPHHFPFAQIVRVALGYKWVATTSPSNPQPRSYGLDGWLDKSIVFTVDVNLADNPAEVSVVDWDHERRLRIVTAHFGLLGARGVMPYSYTRDAQWARTERRSAYEDFLSIFQNRAGQFLAKSEIKSRIALSAEAERYGRRDLFREVLVCIDGIRDLILTDNDPFDMRSFVIKHSGLFSHQLRSQLGLARILSDILCQQVEIIPFKGRWVDIPVSEQTRLSAHERLDTVSFCSLGENTIVGSKQWIVEQEFCIRIKIDSREAFDRMMPNTNYFKAFSRLVGLFVGVDFDFRIQLDVRADLVTATRLTADEARPSRLGQTTWLIDGPSPVDRDDPFIRGTDITSYSSDDERNLRSAVSFDPEEF